MKRITALLLTFILAVFSAVPSLAATNGTTGSMQNFSKQLTYTSGMFKDVDENVWYGANRQACIKTVYELGIMDGMGDGNFLPGGNIRLSEIIKMAAVVHSIYAGATDPFGSSIPWYQSYVNYAVENGIIKEGQYHDFTAFATRTDVAYIFSGSLPEAEFAAINTVNSIPDVNITTQWRDPIFLLYRAGVISGDDQTRTYRPMDRCSRAEAAAIITRVISPAARLRFDILTYNADPGDHHPDFAVQNAAGDTLALGHQAAGTIRTFFGTAPSDTEVWVYDKGINIASSSYPSAPDVRYLNSANAESGVYVYFLRFTSDAYKTLSGIGCGSTVEEVRAAYKEALSYEAIPEGSPWNYEGVYSHYSYENGQVLSVSFYVDEGRVIELTLSCNLY